MESLLSNYASSDDEEDSNPQHLQNKSQVQSQPQPQPQPQPQSQSQSQSQSTPKSLFLSLPPPKSDPNPLTTQPKLFSSLPNPTTNPKSNPRIPFSKKVILIRPPTNLKDEDSDDEKQKSPKKNQSSTQAPSVKSFLSTIPPPKNSSTLGVLPSSSGSNRRSIIETDANSAITHISKPSDTETFTQTTENYVEYGSYDVVNVGSASGDQVNYESYGGDPSNLGLPSENYANNDGYSGYSDYGQYESKWVDRSDGIAEREISGVPVESLLRVPGKRGRSDIPTEIIEVKQDELMKNRPREDQAKVTGIAFGPSYQPVSAKGKPSKLHKRKHQIGSLYFDMRQNESELAERRSKGFLTKAETQAKYGW